jgi:hypothetical protein
MASEVDISNLALAHLGDSATVSSLYPPEGSAQAEHCARFYPIARDSIQELYNWGFATRRTSLSQVVSENRDWLYAYVPPANMLNSIAILSADNTTGNIDSGLIDIRSFSKAFSTESLQDGTVVLYSNEPDAVLKYSARVTDTTKFSSLFTLTLSWQLASMIAGPLLKGEAGALEAARCAKMAESLVRAAEVSDATQMKIIRSHKPSWVGNR